jgi:hypothetical protein
MAVPEAKFKGLDPTGTSIDSIADHAGTGAGESGLAILLPGSVQRLEPRRREGVPRAAWRSRESSFSRRDSSRSRPSLVSVTTVWSRSRRTV